MSLSEKIKYEWFGNVRGDIISGILVALALIPEAIAFSIIAEVDPMVGLYASFCIAIVIAFLGGRTGMISAATGAMALVMVTLVRDYGLQYLLAATILTGIIQLILGYLKVGNLMKFVPRSVMIGFVNALAILIFMAQLVHFVGINNTTYIFVAATLAIIYILPRFTNILPSPLVAIVVITMIAVFGGFNSLNTVGDLGTITSSLPNFFIPDVPFTLETLLIILPYSLSLAIVGLLESLLTAQIVDDMTDTESDKNRESRGQGIANVVTGFFGGMAGCAMIGQSVINVKSGGRGRLSTLVAGLFLLFLILVLADVVSQIPMAALVGVMIMVSIGTFDWKSLVSFKKVPVTDSIVMVVTVVTVVLTHNLAIGVFAGILLSAIFFMVKISKVRVETQVVPGTKVYKVYGQLFFASVTEFVNAIDLKEADKVVVLDLTNSHVWDDSAVAAIDKVVLKLRDVGTEVTIKGMNEASTSLVGRLAVYDKEGASLGSGH